MTRQTFRTHDHHGNPHPPAMLAFRAAQAKRDTLKNRLHKASTNPALMTSAEYTAAQAELRKMDAECTALGKIADAERCCLGQTAVKAN
ncbi:MAG: hypothetical protein H7Y38_14530 [Armatimonadetes bacterium]|nr:hypothetical protein [Armatimonadota bacterium]